MVTVLLQKLRKYRYWRRLKAIRPEPNQYYFAYGANVASTRFDQNHMHSRLVGPAVLPNHRIEFSLTCQYVGMGYGSVAREEGNEVWGVLYQMDPVSLDLLDVLEWVNYGYYRRVKAPVKIRDTGKTVDAWVYVANQPKADLIPSTEYLSVMIRNSRAAKHPEAFIAQLERTSSRPVAEFELNIGYRISRLDKTRPFVKELGPLYKAHDKLRQRLMTALP